MDKQQFEQLVGGKALNLAGLLLVFLGTGFFLKLAFDHNWIAPPERIALGIAAGIALVIYAQFLARRGDRYFGDGITALGAAIEFLTLYAAGPYFHLFLPAEVFAGMVAVSATLAALGWHHRSERLGTLGAIAGFAAPILIGAPHTNEWLLGSYLAILTAGLLVLGELLQSKILAPLALFGTLAYAFGHFYLAQILPVERVEIFGLLYATFTVAGWVTSRLRPGEDPIRTAIACVTLAMFVPAACGLLADQRSLLGIILFAIAALHAGAAVFLKLRYQRWLAALVLELATLIYFSGAALATAWAVEAAALVTLGVFLKDPVMRYGGIALLGVDLVNDLLFDSLYTANQAIWNRRFVSLSALVAATFTANAALGLKPARTTLDENESSMLRLGAHAIALWMLTAEAWDYASSGALHVFGTQAANAAVSILWTLFATVLIAKGLRKHEAMLRWEGLALIIVAVAKVFIVNLSSLDFIYRVLSGLVVGVVLIGVSYAYQHRRFARKDDGDDDMDMA